MSADPADLEEPAWLRDVPPEALDAEPPEPGEPARPWALPPIDDEPLPPAMLLLEVRVEAELAGGAQWEIAKAEGTDAALVYNAAVARMRLARQHEEPTELEKLEALAAMATGTEDDADDQVPDWIRGRSLEPTDIHSADADAPAAGMNVQRQAPATPVHPAGSGRPRGMDAADLLALDLAPLRWVVPELLPEGTTILAAPPKVGKSCLVYQVAVEASLGGDLLGRRVQSGSVLYLALEDGRRRGQERLRAALAGRTMPGGRLEIRWEARKIGEGLEDDVSAWLDEHPDATMVAIDTLGKVRPPADGRRNAYEVDVAALARLQDLFRDRPVALVIVHHARKEAHDDFLASVSGTYGITGSADTIIVIRRKRLEAFGTLLVTGRDVADAEIPARFDGLTWHAAPGALPNASMERLEVLQAIEAHGPIFAKALGDLIGSERTNVQHLIDKLVQSGAVARTTRGYVAAAQVFDPEPALARAQARVSLVPLTHSGESGDSERSEHGHPRATDSTRPALPTVLPEPPELFAPASRPPCFSDPDLYRAHQSEHYVVKGADPGCAACEASR